MSDLENVKAGDKVLYYPRYGDPHSKIVKRVTPSQIVFELGAGEYKFHKKNGREVGGSSYGSAVIKPFDQSVLIAVEIKQKNRAEVLELHKLVEEHKVRGWPPEKVRHVLKAIQEWKE